MAKVMLVMLDGVRPDAIEAARCPNVDGLRAAGASTMRARSLLPGITLPCHTSIFHSVPPARHGVTSNVWQPMARPLPGLFEVVREAGGRSAMLFNWEPLRDLGRPGSLDFFFFRSSQYQRDGDDVTADEAARLLAREQPDFMFVYFGTVDATGHDCGWMSGEYLAQLERVDAGLGRLLDALPGDYAVVLQADHGGHERDHGLDIAEDMTIPWLAAGPGVKQGHDIQAPVSLLSSAPTIARLLGIGPHHQWEGACLDEIFADSAPKHAAGGEAL